MPGAAPVEMEGGVMILGIIHDNNDLAPTTSGEPLESTQKVPTGLSVKAALWLKRDQPTVGDSYRAEIADAFASRRVLAGGITNLRKDPHLATIAVLLEMDFVYLPRLDLISARQALEYFLLPPALAGRTGQFLGEVCANEIRVAETAVGIVGHVARCQISSRENSTEECRPKAAPAIHSRPDFSSGPPLPVSFRAAPNVIVGLDPLARSARRSRPSRNEKPNLPPSHENPHVPRPPADSSFPLPPAKPHANDCRSAHRGCVEFRPEAPGSSFPCRISSVLSCTVRLDDKTIMSN
jgi:hypothetical protein